MDNIPLANIRENPVALRNVQKESEEFQGLVDSIRSDGVYNPIVVRPHETEPNQYILVDGLQRFSAAKEAGLTEIPAHVKDIKESQVLEAQIITNIHKIETQPTQYSAQLRRILAQNPLMTELELATKLSKSLAWIQQRLGLVKLHADIAKLVDEGTINLSNAYPLTKLPADEQLNFIQQAQSMQPQEFTPIVNNRIKELREAARKGRDASPAVFQPVAYLRKVAEINDERSTLKNMSVMLNGVTDPVQAAKLALDWVMHLDPAGAQEQIDKEAKRKADLEDAKKKRKEEAASKKAAAATSTAAAVVA